MENQNELRHYGVIGMKWGVRRYQKKDGTYTMAGRKRYSVGQKIDVSKTDTKTTQKVKSDYNNLSDQDFLKKYSVSKDTYRKRVNTYGDPYANRDQIKKDRIKKAVVVGAGVTAAAAAVVGGMYLAKHLDTKATHVLQAEAKRKGEDFLVRSSILRNQADDMYEKAEAMKLGKLANSPISSRSRNVQSEIYRRTANQLDQESRATRAAALKYMSRGTQSNNRSFTRKEKRDALKRLYGLTKK